MLVSKYHVAVVLEIGTLQMCKVKAQAKFACLLQGDLSLLADKGHAGLPLGHVIAYKADHEMHVEFAKKLKASCGPADVVAVEKA